MSLLSDMTLLARDYWERYLQVRVSPDGDALTQTRERVLHYLLLSLSVLSVVVFVPFTNDTIARTQSWELFLGLLVAVIVIWTVTLNQEWPYYLRTAVLITIFYAIALHDLATIGLAGANNTFLLFLPILVFTLLNLTAGIIATVSNIILYAVMAWSHNAGNLPLEPDNISLYLTAEGWFVIGAMLGILCLLSAILLSEMSSNVASAMEEEATLDRTLQQEQIILQARIQARTRGLQASTEVSRRISTILDTKELADTVVQQIQLAFGYYNVQLYTFDREKQYLNLVAATGSVGQEMLKNKHRQATWRGVIGQAGGSGQPQLVVNIANNPHWLPNPLLPDTVTELAVPILSGAEIIGVLDVQHNVPQSLDEDTVYTMQTISSQIAVAFQNAALYEQAEAQARREELLATISEKIQRASSTEEALQVTAQTLTETLKLRRTAIELGLS
jgi:putative methionine-R-sulfoxide reductase with GAF domain